MASWSDSHQGMNDDSQSPAALFPDGESYAEAEAVLQNLASVFLENTSLLSSDGRFSFKMQRQDSALPSLEAKYRALVEQIPAVVFMAYLDEAMGEAYVSPQIESLLGFTQEEWLQDPVRWYSQVHPDDKMRWSVEAAELFFTGKPLRSAYRVLSRDGRVIWFHCEAKMIRRDDGSPWFIHGVGFDITDLKRTEEALEEERNVVTAILDTVGALVIVLDAEGRIVRFNRACERSTGYTFAEAAGKHVWDLFIPQGASAGFKMNFEKMRAGQLQSDYECHWLVRDGTRRLIAWSGTSLGGRTPAYVIATGIDITERKQLEKAILDISEREQRRIGQDLHDGLGQHLTGIAFMSKVQEQKLKEKRLPYAADAAKIVRLVNQAIDKTRELARGLSPVVSDSHGLMSALRQLGAEVEDVFGVTCHLRCETPVLIDDVSLATHLYHISQEAVSNSVKHGKARTIEITLAANENRGMLTIQDDGLGCRKIPVNSKGMGHHIMTHRAKMIGGTLDIHSRAPHGTVVSCIFPVRGKE